MKVYRHYALQWFGKILEPHKTFFFFFEHWRTCRGQANMVVDVFVVVFQTGFSGLVELARARHAVGISRGKVTHAIIGIVSVTFRQYRASQSSFHANCSIGLFCNVHGG